MNHFTLRISLILLSCLFTHISLFADCTSCASGTSEVLIYIYGDQHVDIDDATISATVNGSGVTLTNLETSLTDGKFPTVVSVNRWHIFSAGCQADGGSIIVFYTETFNGLEATVATDGGMYNTFVYSDGVLIGRDEIFVAFADNTPTYTITDNCDTPGACTNINGVVGVLANDQTNPTFSELVAVGENDFDDVVGDEFDYDKTVCGTFTATSTEMNCFAKSSSWNLPFVSVDRCIFESTLSLYDSSCSAPLASGVTLVNYTSFMMGQTYTLCRTSKAKLSIPSDYPEYRCDLHRAGMAVSAVTSPTPVELETFTGEVREDVNLLTWETASELNVNEFIIERSSDGYSFDRIGTSKAENAATGARYNFMDKSPSPVSYYRLKILDNDGSYEYSNTLTLKMKAKMGIVSISPIPAQVDLNISLISQSDSDGILSIYDAMGRLVDSRIISVEKGDNNTTLNISELSKGIYILQVEIDGQLSTERIVKQ